MQKSKLSEPQLFQALLLAAGRLNDKIVVDCSQEGSKEWQGKLLGGADIIIYPYSPSHPSLLMTAFRQVQTEFLWTSLPARLEPHQDWFEEGFHRFHLLFARVRVEVFLVFPALLRHRSPSTSPTVVQTQLKNGL